MSSRSQFARPSRREALRFLGIGAAALTLPATSAFAQALTFPRGAVIRTILSDIAPGSLTGATLFHEHMSLAANFLPRWIQYARDPKGALEGNLPPPTMDPAAPPFFMADPELMAAEMRAAKADGIGCIVDGGHADMGRDFGALRELSMKSGLPIVASGGFYAQPFYPPEVRTWSEEQITQELVRQATAEPIGAFGEIGSWDEITDLERKVFRAIGKASAATNLPIFTHTGIPGKSAVEQLDLLEKGGARPAQIVIGHLGDLTDPKAEVHKAICKRGAFVGFDRQGGATDDQRIPTVLALLEAGYADNLMFASDFSSPQQLKKNNGPGYAKTLTVWVPKLKAAGVKDDVLNKIMQDNPRRFLAFVPKIARKA